MQIVVYSHLDHVAILDRKGREGISGFLSWGKVLGRARQFCFDWHEAKTHQHSLVLSLCIRRRWRGLILHSRVDQSLVCFIHFTWRDACLSWLDASLHFTAALHTPNNASVLFATGILWGVYIRLHFWVKISLALLFSGQGILLYRKSCHGAFPHPFSSCSSCKLLGWLSSCKQCICLPGPLVRSDSRSCIIKKKIFRMLKIAFVFLVFFDWATRPGHMLGCTLLHAF